MILGGTRMSPSATTLRTEIVRTHGGFNERKDFISAEDFDLWLRLAHEGAKFHFLNEVLGEYTLRGSNLSANHDRHHQIRRAMYDEHLKRYSAELGPYRQRILGSNLYAFGRSLQTSGDFGRARRAYWGAIREGYLSPKVFAAWTLNELRIKV
jgi:GT2 family glycosyltransferase